MAEIDLKAYTSRAVELETAIYTQRRLMQEHQEHMLSQRPKAPHMPELKAPVKPRDPIDYTTQLDSVRTLVIAGIVASIFIILLLIVLPLLGVAVMLFCLCLFGNISASRQKAKENTEEEKKRYEDNLIKYNQDLEAYSREYQLAHDRYHKALEKHTSNVEVYEEQVDSMMRKHAEVLASLETALKDLYSKDVIFPKYRNIVAMTTINEYLMSGRCFELEGPNGAYNLFEMELRQNIIISQLSTIISNLEQIRNNQFSLYCELMKANSTVDELLHEIRGVKKNTKLTAYFAAVTAMIEASPKYYISTTI